MLFCHHLDDLLQRLPLLEVQVADRALYGFPRLGGDLLSGKAERPRLGSYG